MKNSLPKKSLRPSKSPRKSRVVFLDDDVAYGQLLSHVATKLGFIAQHFETFEEIDQPTLRDADVLVVDYNLAGETGVDVGETLARRRCKKPILLVSGTQDAVKLGEWPNNIRSFASKAIGPFAVLDSIRNLLPA